MENHEFNQKSLRTPLSIKTHTNIQSNTNVLLNDTKNIKNNTIENLNSTKGKIQMPKDKNNKFNTDNNKHNLFFEEKEQAKERLPLEFDEDDFSYNNYNSNFRTKEVVEEENCIELDKINLKEEVCIELKLKSDDFTFNADIDLYIQKIMDEDIIYVNDKDIERREAINNFINQGLFFENF